MASQKIDKDYVLSDSSVNVYGMKLLTSGYDMAEFKKNPIGYYGHKKDDGVLLKWDDLRLDGDRVLGKPVINLEHPRAQRTIKEIEDGFLNAASVGKFVIVDAHLEDNPADPDDPILVADRWYHKECSLVDNPGNRNAMKVELCDRDDNELNLDDLKSGYLNKRDMKKTVTLELTPEILGLLNLSGDKATAEAVAEGIKDLHGEKTKLEEKLEKAEKDLADGKKAEITGRVKSILDKGVSDKKMTVETRKKLEVQFAEKPDELSDLVDTMPVFQSVVDQIDGVKAKKLKDVKDLADKSWDELDLSDKLEDLKANDLEAFKAKWKQKFGTDYKG